MTANAATIQRLIWTCLHYRSTEMRQAANPNLAGPRACREGERKSERTYALSGKILSAARFVGATCGRPYPGFAARSLLATHVQRPIM